MTNLVKKSVLLFCYCLVFLCWIQASNAGVRQICDIEITKLSLDSANRYSSVLTLAAADVAENGNEEQRPGSILLSDDYIINEDEEEDKKCMTVCKRWGQDCMIDPIRGRKCRRTCKEFGQECF